MDKYSISQKRYRELYYFCRQYSEWVESLRHAEDCLKGQGMTGMPSGRGMTGDQTGDLAVRRVELREKCGMVEQSAVEADSELYQFVLKNVTRGIGYECLRTRMGMPAGKNKFYEARRRFFWILDKKKK